MQALEIGNSVPDMLRFKERLQELGIDLEIYEKGKVDPVSGDIRSYEVRSVEGPQEIASSGDGSRFLSDMSLYFYKASEIIKTNRELLGIAESLTTQRTLSECSQFAVEAAATIFSQCSLLTSGFSTSKQPAHTKVFYFAKARPTLEDLSWSLSYSWACFSPCLIQVSRRHSLSALVLAAILTERLALLRDVMCLKIVDDLDGSFAFTSNKLLEEQAREQVPETRLLHPFGSKANGLFVAFENCDIESAAYSCLQGHFFSNNESSYSISQTYVQSSIKLEFLMEIERLAGTSFYAGHFVDRNIEVVAEKGEMMADIRKLSTSLAESHDGTINVDFAVTDRIGVVRQLPKLEIKEFATALDAFKVTSHRDYSYASIWTNSLMLGLECASKAALRQILLNQTITPTTIVFQWLSELRTVHWCAREHLYVPQLPSLSLHRKGGDGREARRFDFFSNDRQRSVDVVVGEPSAWAGSSEEEASHVQSLLSISREKYRKFASSSEWWPALLKIASQLRFNLDQTLPFVCSYFEDDKPAVKARLNSWAAEMLTAFASLQTHGLFDEQCALNDWCSFVVNSPRGLIAICVDCPVDCGLLFVLALLAAVRGNSVVLACSFACPELMQLAKVLNNCGIPAGMITFLSGVSKVSCDNVRRAAKAVWEVSSDQTVTTCKWDKSRWIFFCSADKAFMLASEVCSCERRQIIVPAEFSHGV